MDPQGTKSLQLLQELLTEVYWPLLNNASTDVKLSETLKNEFISNLQKFSSQIAHTIQQVTGDVRLHIPHIHIRDVQSVADDQQTLSKIEAAVEEWNPLIASLLERESHKTPQGNGPMAEIDFWREKNAILNTLFEQLQNPTVKKMIEVLEHVDSPILHAFRTVTNDLTKQYNEAKENVKFLSTLERHFKNISQGSLITIKDTLPSMMNAIRMVWIISRYYNRDEYMTPLLERIAWEIANKVSNVINVRTILRDPDGMKKIQEGKDVLEKWKDTYREIREKIEQSGSDDRWEFDKKKLFDQTDYMAERCTDLYNVAQVLEEFHNILGPELKAVTGESHQIDEVLQRVKEMIHSIESVPFDVFDKRYQTSWETVMSRFNETVQQVEEMTKQFIDASFNHLRSAEGAFDLLQNFKNLKSRAAIEKQMNDKFSDVLRRYMVELQKVKEIFEQQQVSPPIPKNQPAVAGAINWSRQLFYRIKKPIVKFKTLPDKMLNTESGRTVEKEYIAVGKALRDYEQRLFKNWSDSVEQVALNRLKEFILIVDAEGKIQVNFHVELKTIIRETKYLDQLGLKIPDTALSVTLQEEKYHKYVDSLKLMLKSYYAAIDKIIPAERQLLTQFTDELRNVLKPGLETLNWNSLGISDFIKKCEQEINKFQSVVNQIQKNASMIGSVVVSIANASLVPPINRKSAEDALDMQEFLDSMEKQNTMTIEDLVRKYRTIGPLLGKIEGIIEHKNTLKSPRMKSYYEFWERRIFNALNRMVLANLSTLQAILNSTPKKSLTASAPASNNANADTEVKATTYDHPLFQVVASLSAPEVVISPSFNDIKRIFNKMMMNLMESTKLFIRWMNGTCMETPPQFVNEDEEPIIFSFYQDISNNLQVVKSILLINQSLERTFGKINKYLDGWRRYRPLWKMDKGPILDKFSQKGPSVVEYDSKLILYSKLGSEVENLPTEKDIDFIRLSCVPLEAAIKSESSSWVQSIGELLHNSAKQSLTELQDEFARFEGDLGRKPETMEDLKFILHVIDTIRSSSMDIEIKYLDIEERYRTLLMHGISTPATELDQVSKLRLSWLNLLRKCKEVDESLVSVKVQFTDATKKQVEDFKRKVSKLKKKFQKEGPGAEGIEMDYGLELVKKYQKELQRFNKIRDDLVLAEKLFNLAITSYPKLMEIETELEGLAKIYSLYYDQKEAINRWANTLWADLDMEVLSKGIEEFVIKLKRFPPELKQHKPFAIVTELINSFKESIPLFRHLKNEALRPRHWKTLMEVTGQSFQTNSKTFTLESIFKMELHKYAEKIEEITSAASKELSIEQGIQKIADTWKNMRFEIQKYYKGTEDRGYILKGIDDIIALYDDNSMSLQSMSASRYVSPFLPTVQKWEKTLSLIAEVTEVWMLVQRKWMYLENIFLGSEDIRLRLPEEAKRFDRIDKTFKKIMTETAKNTLVLEACQMERLELLKSLATQLEACQKSLSEYLLTKRNAFPRFFFISDDELLSIIGSQDPNNVQEHMIKLFDNVIALKFGANRNVKSVVGMISSQLEAITFRQPVLVEGQVEHWMSQVEAEMKRTLRIISKEATFYYPKTPRVQWIYNYPGMVTILGGQIWWTWDVEDTFRKVREGDKHAMKNLSAKLANKLQELVGEVRKDLTENDRTKVNTLIIVDVHARDVIDRFVKDSILDEKEFEWESQLRYYWDKNIDDVLARQCTGAFNYGYEYLGLSGRLVITPLTERCIMTLTQALSMKLGGSPAGPAGTGKTETVKDLAKALGLYCVVFNCSEGLDYSTMGSIFSGLVQCGGWGCFDEFNRIDAEVLSVISVQIKTIQHAMRSGLTRFPFEGNDISLDMKAGIFITMNPHYAGRAELPDNLKSLFRPVVMVVPDLELICEIMLFSEGFSQAKVLAKKMTVLYQLCKEQLSKQHHYDFGLRAIKAVLVRAGSLKRDTPDLPEAVVLVSALKDMNLPKFVFEDVPLFAGLINDLFPGLEVPPVRTQGFAQAIEQALREHDYQVIPDQVDKVIQLAETMKTRHTSMVVGPSGGGKSVIMETLARAQTIMGNPTKLFIINPKAQTVNELYGVLDMNTRDWTDGLLSSIFRDINKPSDKKDLKYIVFDGDVDTVWVENMNSVMDDNKLLTLPNGERIRLQKHCSLLFEVSDLKHASPATVSRCGMVFMDPRNLGYKPFFLSWLNTRSKLEADILKSLFDKYIPYCVDYIFEGIINDMVTERLKTVIPVNAVAMVKQLCTMLTIVLVKDEVMEHRVIESLFIFCIIWSLGAALVEESRKFFDAFVKRLSDWTVIENPDIVAGPGQLPAAYPTLYDYYFNTDELRWLTWISRIGTYKPPPDTKFHQLLVPTVDTVRNTWLLNACVAAKVPTLFVGESGTAKTVTVNNYLSTLDGEKFVKLNISFSSRTTSMDLQRTLEYNVERWSKGTYGPSPGKQLVVFVDDLNMPLLDKYGTQQPLALFKLLLEKGGLYDRGKELNWKNFRNVQFVCAMAPPGGGRNPVDPRFISLFNVFYVSPPSHESLTRIYSTILMHHLEPFHDGIKEVGANMTEATLKLYEVVCKRLPPTPSKFHYVWNIRDLSRVYEGMCMSTLDKFDTAASFVRLWRNECLRVFSDRLITEDDQQIVSDTLMALLAEHFPEQAAAAMVNPVVFGNYKALEEEVRIYEDYQNYEAIKPFFDDMLMTYNERMTPMNLVLFDDALEHLTRILRIIRRPRGHALLIGLPGSGKQSLARLAAFVARYQIFEIVISRNYDETSLREDIKKLYNMLGVDGKEVVFMFTESHLSKEAFMEYINNMLTSGMVPALYTDDEKDSIINNIRDEVVKARIFDSKENCWNYFINKCRNNLHIVLCLSPGDLLRKRCRNFPGLINNTAIDWFSKWPEQALHSVATHFLTEEAGVPPEYRLQLVKHVVSVHLSVLRNSIKFEELHRHNYVTPTNFLDFIGKYLELLRDNKKKIIDGLKRFDGGLKKLIEAAQYLDQLNVKLIAQKATVDQKAEANNSLLIMISENKAKVQTKQALATAKERELKELQGQILTKKQEAETSLEAALPMVEAARAALTNLNKADITELRSFATPPKAVQLVAQCVCILTGLKDVSWKGAKQMMAASGFLNDLLMMSPDDITEKQIKSVKELLKKLDTTADKMESISVAGNGLMNWVQAIVKYYSVAKAVIPKRKAVEAAIKNQKQNEKDLETIKLEIHTLGEELAKLEEQYAKGSAEQQELKEQAELMEKRLVAASKLISGLGTERVRWTREMEILTEKRRKLVGDCMVAAAFLSYAGPFNFDFRKDLIAAWILDLNELHVPLSENWKLEELLTDEVEISRWASEGLPPDELSVQNGILITRASRWPLCIDPQMQAVNWITKKEAKQKLIVRTFHDNDFAKQLELAITFGIPMLIEGVDEYIDPILDPVLDKNIKVSGSRKFIRLGDRDVDWNDNFRLYMTTKLANPDYGPSIFGKTMVVNCNLTLQGLQDQLLNVVVGYEQPDLEHRRESLITEMSENRTLLKNFEDTLLRELAASSGNMLDNQELISTLEGTKEKSVEIAEKLALAKETSQDIEKLREGYSQAARRGAILFFVLTSLSAVNEMYQYALTAFLEVFKKSLALAPYDAVLSKRLKNIIETLTAQVYNYTCMGLFEKHKLMFSFQMCIAIMDIEDGTVDNALLDFFLRGNRSLERIEENNPYPWLSEQGWRDLNKLQSINPAFETLFAHFTNPDNEAKWKAWYDSETPESVHPPAVDAVLNEFQQLAVLRCFRTDRLYMALTRFIISNMGSKFVEPPVVKYQDIYELSTPYSPIIFVLSPGADPANDVRKLAEKMGFGGNRLKEHPLGQNQGPIAASLLEVGAGKGHWIMLQNCHLLTSWLRTLEKLLERIQEKPHKDFRVWLTTEPTPKFPIGILQRSLKVVTEPPNGLKLNMTSSYSKINDETLSQCPHPAFRPLVYVLAFFHAVVQERRKYGTIGWNVSYDFNESDFSTSLMLLNTYLTKAHRNREKQIPWASLRYLIGEVMYGGRVTDTYDRRILKTYLDEYMGDFVFDTFQPFHFYQDEKIKYSIPSDGQVQKYLGAIEALPHVNSPEVFGLHSNAEIMYYTNASSQILSNLVQMQVSSGGETSNLSMNRDQTIAQIARDIQNKLPELFDLAKINKELHAQSIAPTQVVLLQELERWNELVFCMKTSLHQLQQALIGEIGLSSDLEELSTHLYIGNVPSMWRKLAPFTQMTLPIWMNHFQKRYHQYVNWIKDEPPVIWLAGLHVPESYLKALIQTACRKNGWPLDKTTIFTRVTKFTQADQVTERPESSCYVTGLYMEGASWDNEAGVLTKQKAKQLISEMPIIELIPTETHRLKLQNTFKTPVYITQERCNKMGVGLIFEADLPTLEHQSHWVLQGVCLLLNKAD